MVWGGNAPLMPQVSADCLVLSAKPGGMSWLTLPATAIVAMGLMCLSTLFIARSWIWVFAAADLFVCLCSQPFILVNACSEHVIIDMGPSMTGRGSHCQTIPVVFFCYTMWTGELMCDVYLRIPSHLDTLWDAPLTWTSWRIKCIPLWRLSSLAKMESFNKTVFHGTFPKDEGIVPRTWQGIHFIVMAPKFAGHESNQAFAVWVGETVASSITTTT